MTDNTCTAAEFLAANDITEFRDLDTNAGDIEAIADYMLDPTSKNIFDGVSYVGRCGTPDRDELIAALVDLQGDATQGSESPDAWHGHIYDAETGEQLGEVTAAQGKASAAAGPEGFILIDADGDVVEAGSWAAQQAGVRKVYRA